MTDAWYGQHALAQIPCSGSELFEHPVLNLTPLSGGPGRSFGGARALVGTLRLAGSVADAVC